MVTSTTLSGPKEPIATRSLCIAPEYAAWPGREMKNEQICRLLGHFSTLLTDTLTVITSQWIALLHSFPPSLLFTDTIVLFLLVELIILLSCSVTFHYSPLLMEHKINTCKALKGHSIAGMNLQVFMLGLPIPLAILHSLQHIGREHTLTLWKQSGRNCLSFFCFPSCGKPCTAHPNSRPSGLLLLDICLLEFSLIVIIINV